MSRARSPSRGLVTVKANDVTAPHGVGVPLVHGHLRRLRERRDRGRPGRRVERQHDATLASGAGSYPITPSGLTASNYRDHLRAGTLTLTNQAPVARQRQLQRPVEHGDGDRGTGRAGE